MIHSLSIPLLVLVACASGQGVAQDARPQPLVPGEADTGMPVGADTARPGGTAPLIPGEADRGLALIRDPSRASCLICHSIAALPDRDQGELGPPLDGVAAIYGADELRQRVIDARRVSPDTIMPPYYSTEGLFGVGSEWAGQTIYSAQEVEDVVAFLLTLVE